MIEFINFMISSCIAAIYGLPFLLSVAGIYGVLKGFFRIFKRR
jgi:hypothetical protein